MVLDSIGEELTLVMCHSGLMKSSVSKGRSREYEQPLPAAIKLGSVKCDITFFFGGL